MILVEHKNLNLFLKKNSLEIIRTMAGTDIDQSFAIVHEDYDIFTRHIANNIYISFFYEVYDGSMFSWDTTNRPCMNEDEFISKLKEILASDNTYRFSGSMKD